MESRAAQFCINLNKPYLKNKKKTILNKQKLFTRGYEKMIATVYKTHVTYLHPGSWVASSPSSKQHKTAPWHRSLPIFSSICPWICCCPYPRSDTAHPSPAQMFVKTCSDASFVTKQKQLYCLHYEVPWNMDTHQGSLWSSPLLSGHYCQWRLVLLETQGQGCGRQHLGWVLFFYTSPAVFYNVWPVLSGYPCLLMGKNG